MDKLYRFGFLFVLFFIGITWARSSFGKIGSGTFVQNLSTTLNKFTSNNPNLLYKDFLKQTVIPNTEVFGNLVLWGEFLTGASITIASLYLLFHQKRNGIAEMVLFAGLLGGVFLNLNFWLAAGWTSQSTDGLNLLMLSSELVGVILLARGRNLSQIIF